MNKQTNKALSIKQPWLWAIFDLDKSIENRTWKPPDYIIGKRIWLHASKKDDGFAFSSLISHLGPARWTNWWGQIEEKIGHTLDPQEVNNKLPRGAIVGSVKVRGYIEKSSSPVPQPPPWFVGPIGWVWADVKMLSKPIRVDGKLGLWNVPDDILRQIENQESNNE